MSFRLVHEIENNKKENNNDNIFPTIISLVSLWCLVVRSKHRIYSFRELFQTQFNCIRLKYILLCFCSFKFLYLSCFCVLFRVVILREKSEKKYGHFS